MFEILIADDEYFIRERLKNLIDYTPLGFEIIADVDNGEKAYGIIVQEKPDLAILDIKMPLLTGLEVADKVHNEKLNTKIIILTSYDYFTFAQQSIRYGVYSYLLKPVNKEELKDLLIEVKEKIIIDNRINYIVDSYQSKTNENAFMNYILRETLTLEETRYVQTILYSEFGKLSNALYLCLMKFQNIEGEIDISNIRKIIETQSLFPGMFYFQCSDNILGILFSEQKFIKITQRISCFRRLLLDPYGYASTITLNPTKADYNSLPGIYENSLYTLQQTIFLDNNPFLYSPSDFTRPESVFTYHCHIRDSLLLYLRVGNAENIEKVLDCVFKQLRDSSPTINNLTLLLSEIFLTCNIHLNEISRPDKMNIIYYVHELIENYTSLEDIIEWCKYYILNICQCNNKKLDSSTRSAVLKVTKLIESLYPDPDLDLNYIAAKAGYSPSYLSGTYKKVTGFSIVQYITKCRMEAAQTLLATNKLKITDICEKIGYSDSLYFSKRFRNYFGCSPSEYMNMIRSKSL